MVLPSLLIRRMDVSGDTTSGQKEFAILRVLTLSTLFPDANRPTFGGFVERQTLGLAARKGVEVQVAAPIGLPPGPLKWVSHYSARAALPSVENWKGLTVHRPRFLHIPGPGIQLTPSSMVRKLLPYLRKLRRDFPFDVIDAEYFWPDGVAAARLGKALNVPVSIKARGSDIHAWGMLGFGRAQILEAGKGAQGMLAVSGALRDDMVALGLPEDKIKVHYTGVDLDRFNIADRETAKTALGITGPLMLCVGNLVPLKRQHLVIEALRHLPDTSLLIVGDGPERGAFEAQIAGSGFSGRAHLFGVRPHEALPALFAAADVFVHPSSSEGLANVWIESLACGTPIVISDVGGAREVVDSAAAGSIVEPTPLAIARAVGALLTNPPDRSKTRRSAERFTWTANAEALHAHLSALVERHQRGGDPAIFPA
jgi:teichuronic acid biosynthesis glycosyltransferase TuaC